MLESALLDHLPEPPPHLSARRERQPASFGKYMLAERLASGSEDECWAALVYGSNFDHAVFVRRWPRRQLRLPPQFDSWSATFGNYLLLKDPSLETIYELGLVDRTPFMVSQYVQGAGLDDLAGTQSGEGRRGAPMVLSWPLALSLLLLGRKALARLHEAGITHRALSPGRVRLQLGPALVVLCSYFRLVVKGDTVWPPSVEDDGRNVARDVWTMVGHLARLAGAAVDPTLERQLIADGSPEAMCVLSDATLCLIPAPFDELFVNIVALAEVPALERDLVQRLDFGEVSRMWQLVDSVARRLSGP
jgi:hypothetical protein